MGNNREQHLLYAAAPNVSGYGFQEYCLSSHLINGLPLEQIACQPDISGNIQSDLSLLPSFASPIDKQTKLHSTLLSLPINPKFVDARTPSGSESPCNKQVKVFTALPKAEKNIDRDKTTSTEEDKKVIEAHHACMVARKHRSHDTRNLDFKTLRRLAQNREAARKSRLRKKAYVQQLESCRVKLNQLEQEIQRARQQGIFIGGGYLCDQSILRGLFNVGQLSPGAAAFDMEYARWLDDENHIMNELQAALHGPVTDNDLCAVVESCMAHYNEIFHLKSVAAKADVFHLFCGLWKTPAERCFMWMGGFRPSEILKILITQVEPFTDHDQLLNVYKLQHSSQQAEDALSQGMESLLQTLAETLAAGCLSSPDGNAEYMGQMALAMGKLSTLESFVHQADNLRQQTLQQIHYILSVRQAAQGFLAIGMYFSRLRALSSLWSARPRD